MTEKCTTLSLSTCSGLHGRHAAIRVSYKHHVFKLVLSDTVYDLQCVIFDTRQLPRLFALPMEVYGVNSVAAFPQSSPEVVPRPGLRKVAMHQKKRSLSDHTGRLVGLPHQCTRCRVSCNYAAGSATMDGESRLPITLHIDKKRSSLPVNYYCHTWPVSFLKAAMHCSC